MKDSLLDTADIEGSVLGSCLINAPAAVQAIATLGPKDDCFESPANKAIWQSIIRLHSNGDPVDYATVAEDLSLEGSLELAGGATYVSSLSSAVASTAHVDTYARMLRDRHVMRTVRGKLKSLSQDIVSNSRPEDVQDGMRRVEQELAATQRQELPRPVGDVLPGVVEDLNEKWDDATLCDGIPSGFDDLDKLTGGFHGGDLIIIGARPSVGKTAFALAIALNVAKSHSRSHVVFYSLEMSAGALVQRLLGSESSSDMTACHSKTSRARVLDEPAARLAALPLYIQDFRDMDSAKLQADLWRHIAARGKPDLILIDYVQYMRATDRRAPRYQQISEITKSVKAFAREHDVPVVLLSQIGRGAEEKGAEPSVHHLKESGALEEDADLIIILDKDRDDHMKLKVSLAKNRNGKIGILFLEFDRNTQVIDGTRSGGYSRLRPQEDDAPTREFGSLFPEEPDDEPFDDFEAQ